MSFAQVQFGTEHASQLPVSAATDEIQSNPVKTTGDLLAILKRNPTRSLSMLKTVCGHLSQYLGIPGDRIPFDLIETRKCGFRPFLENRRYTENTITSYVSQQRKLLKAAARYGWNPDGDPTPAWQPLLAVAGDHNLRDIIRYFSHITKTPTEVTKEAVDLWGEARIRDGLMFTTVAAKKNKFWKLLEKTGWITATPIHLLKFKSYCIPLKEMPAGLREDIQTVLKWKQAPFAPSRPKSGRIRPATANNLRTFLTQLTGYVIKVAGYAPQSLRDLIQHDHIAGFLEWSMNERHVKGDSVQVRLASILAIMKHHPMFAGQGYSWLKALIDSIPLEDESERKKRKAHKYVDYDELEAIPARIRAFRESYDRRRKKNATRTPRRKSRNSG